MLLAVVVKKEISMSGHKNTQTLFIASLVGCSVAAASYWYLTSRKKKEDWKITELWIYPIKSCRGISLPCTKLAKRGLQFDRIFMLVDAEFKFVSQRTQPKMVLVLQSIDFENNMLTISAPGMETVSFSLLQQPASSPVFVSVWDDMCEADDMGHALADWFQRFLGVQGLRLVRIKDSFIRPTNPKYAPGVNTTLTDGFPILIASEESLEKTNSVLEKKVTIENFRPNVVVRGGAAFAEDTWARIAVGEQGDVLIDVVKPCTRCKMPTVDVASGEMHEDNQPIKAMKPLRSGKALHFQREDWEYEVIYCRLLSVACSVLTIGLCRSSLGTMLTTRAMTR